MAVIIVLTVIFLFIPLAKQDETQNSLTDVINTIKRLVSFYKTEYRNINVDSLYGLRVLEGHTIAIIKKHEGGGLQHLDRQIIADLKAIQNQVSMICEQALRYVMKDDKGYFEQMKFVVSAPWDIFEDQLRKVDLTLEWKPEVYKLAKQIVQMDEEKSDMCMSELIGSHRPGGIPCDISSQCIFMMTTPGLMGYGITHQLLWTMLARKAGCHKKLEQKLVETKRPGLSALWLEFCTNNYMQHVRTLEKFPNNTILPVFQDLYLEQLFVCPSLGFYELLDIKLLPQVISWQYRNGCYGVMKRPKLPGSGKVDLAPIVEDSDYDYSDDDNMKELVSFGQGINLPGGKGNIKIDHHGEEGHKIHVHHHIGLNRTGRNLLGHSEYAVVKGRKLLVEKSMAGGCLAHKTGVAAGALVIYLRLLCEPNAEAIFNHSVPVKLKPENVPGKPQVSHNHTDTLIDKPKGKPVSVVKPGLNKMPQHPDIIDPNEIKPIKQAARVNDETLLNSNQGKSAQPAGDLNVNDKKPDMELHNRVLRHNDPAEQNKMGGNVIDNKVNKIPDLAKFSDDKVKVEGLPGKDANINKNVENEEIKKHGVQGPVVLTMPNDNNDDGDDENDNENGDYKEDDDYDYDDGDNNNDDDNADDYAEGKGDNNNDSKRVPLQKDPDYVDKENNEDDDDYDDANYDDDADDDDDEGYDDNQDEYENDGAVAVDYDDKLKSANNDKVLKSNNNVANNDILKGNINSRNIVNRNDFHLENGDGDNKRYVDKTRLGKNAHDRYAYDDYRKDDDDDEDDDGGDDYDYDDKVEHHEIKDTNSDIKLESVIHPKDTQSGALRSHVNISRDHTVSSNSALFVFAFCFVSVVLLAYRFIKKRRIHFRFHPRISQRV